MTEKEAAEIVGRQLQDFVDHAARRVVLDEVECSEEKLLAKVKELLAEERVATVAYVREKLRLTREQHPTREEKLDPISAEASVDHSKFTRHQIICPSCAFMHYINIKNNRIV